MKVGYPVIQAQIPALGIACDLLVSRTHHRFSFSFGLPSALDSDAGNGENHLLQENGMTYFRAGLDCQLNWLLFKWKGLKTYHGLSSGWLYEHRNLHFFSGTVEKTRDINLYLGPAIRLNYDLNN